MDMKEFIHDISVYVITLSPVALIPAVVNSNVGLCVLTVLVVSFAFIIREVSA